MIEYQNGFMFRFIANPYGTIKKDTYLLEKYCNGHLVKALGYGTLDECWDMLIEEEPYESGDDMWNDFLKKYMGNIGSARCFVNSFVSRNALMHPTLCRELVESMEKTAS